MQTDPNDQPPPNTARVMRDAELEVRPGQLVPVLAQPTTHRLLVLNSMILSHIHVGQALVLRLDGAAYPITIEAIDHLALTARYIDGASDAQ
jgi:hypothetical protein